jgi:4-amino-4-deoxy-L-arabinose transferase-like glycosyltransferase
MKLLQNRSLQLLHRLRQPRVLLILFILVVAAFLRFYKLDEYMTFLGDEGRDALMMRRIWVDWDIPLIGPPMSVGDLYLGPLYYYMMAVAMGIFYLNPVAAAGMVAFIGTATVGLVWYFTKELFGYWAGVVAALLYALSPVTVTYSRASWNPNPVPFFTLLAFICFWQGHKRQDYRWLVGVGVFVSAAVQMHYLSLILVAVFGLLWLVEAFSVGKIWRRDFILGSVGAVVGFWLLFVPLILFEIKHGFPNAQALVRLFGGSENSVSLSLWDTFVRSWPILAEKLVSRYMTGGNLYVAIVISLLLIMLLIIGLWKSSKRYQFQLMSIWLIGGIVGLTMYHSEIHDHYLNYLNPAPYIILGSVLYLISQVRHKTGQLATYCIVVGLIGVLIVLNVGKSPLQYPPNRQLERTQTIAKFVQNLAGDRPYNFALIAENNYDDAYQFYLDRYGSHPAILPDHKTDQLIVVCEDPVCQPVGHRKYEIAAYGWTLIDKEYSVGGVKVYRLIHNPDEERSK